MPILSILSLLLVGLATADPICSHIFGRPSYNDCEELATELTYGWPSDIYKGVKRLNLFSLPGAEIPSWVGRRSRYHHVNLPRFAGHMQEPECMMTLMPLRRDDGQVVVDIGYYTSMSRPAQDINLECIRNKQEGGFTHVGSRGSLILTFYEPGSPFDKAIEQWRQGIPMTCQDTAAAEDVATGTSGSVDAGSCTDTEVNFWDSLSDITQLEPVHSPPVINSAASNTAPKSGEACSGPVNSCATDDGSRCIANLSPGAGNKFYTGTCKPSHFAMNPSGLGSVLVEGQDPIYEINSWIGNTSIPNFVPAMDITAAACPCNCTFVSEACCDAPSGIVHGSAKLKHGELRPEQCSRGSTPTA